MYFQQSNNPWSLIDVPPGITPARSHSISGLKSRVLKLTFFWLKMVVKSGLELFIFKFTEPLQSCCCPVQKNLPSRAELAWQVSRYLWRGSVNFKINSRPLFTIIFKAKNVDFKTRDFIPLVEWILAAVSEEQKLIDAKLIRICRQNKSKITLASKKNSYNLAF